MTRLRRIALAAAVLPLVLLVGLRSAWAAYACRIDREIRTACCCPKKESKAPIDGAARLASACCCDITISETSEPPRVRESQRAVSHDAPLLAAATITFAPLAAPSTRTTTRMPVARPPPSTIPRYLANLSILR